MIENDYIRYYGENNISPVNQDITDFSRHLRRRQKLYRQCGIPTFAFRDAEMLEIGPGGGHNALAPLAWGIHHIDLVEPNAVGVNSINSLFASYSISKERFSVYQMSIEQFDTQKSYDILVAEGFLMYVPNWKEICKKMIEKCRVGGVIVVACADDVSGFVELMKRLVGRFISREYTTLEEKVEALIPVFEPQLKKLRGVSRPVKDWIQDNIFNPAFSKGYALSMGELVSFFRDFDLAGSSPRIFTDYSWYKDIWFDEKKEYESQFQEKRTALVLAGMPETILDTNKSKSIVKLFSDAKKIENRWENTGDDNCVNELLDLLSSGKELIHCMGDDFATVYNEIMETLSILCEGNTPDLDRYENFFKAFGRNEQYLGFMKRGENK